MIEFRWIICLTLWTLLIGPVLDFSHNAPKAQQVRTKTSQNSKSRATR